jgi:gliding motility-associated-like protein
MVFLFYKRVHKVNLSSILKKVFRHKLTIRSVLFVALTFSVFGSPLTSNAQEKCASPVSPSESEAQFENWLRDFKTGNPINARKSAAKFVVRVVVHVIHNGEAKGVGLNIPDAQVASQISVLNADFKRLNADAINTPTSFKSLAGSMDIEFVLAGINRVKGTKSTWTIKDNSELKSLSYWAAEEYVNIWVCDLTDYFGYTQFPVSTLPGLENSSHDRLTDGIIISSKVFGSNDYGNFNLKVAYNKGRTTVHEMGHFFGLRHLWGDVSNCEGTDYVDDTPVQSAATFGCPPHPQQDCNSVNKMFQNYMDFTDDVCMNLFTQGQVERMTIVLENSPRRATLLLPLGKSIFRFSKLFSPNGDGVNDFWNWDNTSAFQGCTLSIFNRFGKKVFEMVSYDNSWDGHSQDRVPLEPEAYYFVIACPNQVEITGGVRIVR